MDIGQHHPNNYIWLCDSRSFLAIFDIKVRQANTRRWKPCKNGIISYCFWKDKYCIVSKFGISCHCAPTSEWYDRSIVSKHSPHTIMTMNHFGTKTKCSLWFENTPYNSTPRNYKFIDLPTKNKHVPNAPATNWSTRIFLITVLVAVPGINFSKALYQVTYNGDSTSHLVQCLGKVYSWNCTRWHITVIAQVLK